MYTQITFTEEKAHIATTDSELAYRFGESVDWCDDEDMDERIYYVIVPADRVHVIYT